MNDIYEQRSFVVKEDTIKAREYITKYKRIMKSDFKNQNHISYSFYDYIFYALIVKCKLDIDRKSITKHLIFRHFIFPFYFLVLSLFIPIESVLLYFAYNLHPTLIGFLCSLGSFILIVATMILCSGYQHDKR